MPIRKEYHVHFSLKKKVAAVATTAVILGGAGAAFGYWTTTGSGEGAASTTAGVSDTLSFTTATIDAMYPGDSEQDVTVTLENDGPDESVYVTSVKAFVTVADGAGEDCDADDFLLNDAEAPGSAGAAIELNWAPRDIAVDASYSTDGLDTIQFNNKATAQDDCKGAVVTLHYLAS